MNDVKKSRIPRHRVNYDYMGAIKIGFRDVHGIFQVGSIADAGFLPERQKLNLDNLSDSNSLDNQSSDAWGSGYVNSRHVNRDRVFNVVLRSEELNQVPEKQKNSLIFDIAAVTTVSAIVAHAFLTRRRKK